MRLRKGPLPSNSEPNHKVLLSILLPNRGGMPYVYSTLDSILECKDSRFELIINDNSSPEKIDYSSYLLDTRVKFFQEESPIPMSENWLHALSHANGEWICFIGSDDGIVAGHLPDFLKYLEISTAEAVTTHETYFQYSIGSLKPQLFAPESESSKRVTVVKFPFKLEAFFPQLRNEMPIPYNFAVVRRSVLENLATKHLRVPGIAPDDFLGQFVAQTCRRGVNYDLSVFIQGNSARSTGRAFALGVDTPGATEFATDSLGVQKALVASYGISCIPARSLEHFIVAWEEIHSRIFWIPFSLLRPWCILTCVDTGHHKGWAFAATLKARATLIKFLTYGIRSLWFMRNFGFTRPSRNFRVTLEDGSNVLTASHYLLEN